MSSPNATTQFAAIPPKVRAAMDLFIEKKPALKPLEQDLAAKRKVVAGAKKTIVSFMKKNDVPQMTVGVDVFVLNTKNVTTVNKEALEKTSTIDQRAKEAFLRENTKEKKSVQIQ